MRIGLNLLYLIPGEVGGTETYASCLLESLLHIGGHEYFAFYPREGSSLDYSWMTKLNKMICPVDARSRMRRYLWEQTKLPNAVRELGLELVHSLGYVSPLRLPCPSIVTIHDTNFASLADSMPFGKRIVLGSFVRQSAKRAARVITVSEFSKSEIIRHIGIEEQKISVIHEGPGKSTVVQAQAPSWDDCRSRWNIQRPYILAMGSRSPHKNISRLIRAFSAIASKIPQDLFVVGHLPDDGSVNVDLQSDTLKGRVTLGGYVSDRELHLLLSNAYVFAFPSWYEGFGLPVLEAQRARVAIACAKSGSLPEIGGNGALFFDPYSVDSISEALETLCLREDVRSRLVAMGDANVSRFSWERAARETAQVYDAVINAS